MRILVIVADSLRYDSALAHSGLMEARDWDAVVPCGAHAPYTPASLTTIATGLHPVQHRYWTFPPHSDDKPHRSSYVFSGDVPAPVAWWSSHPPSTYAWPESVGLYSAEELLRFMRDNSSAVGFVHLWESHIPYEYDHDIDQCIQDMSEMSSVEDRIAYTHNGVDKALEAVRPLLDGVPEDTIVLLTGDHGEALGESNPFPDGRPQRWIHEHTLKEEMLVPMFVDGLDLTAGFVRHSQIVPTIRDQFGLDPIRRLLGAPLDAEHLVGPVSYSMGSCRWAIPEQGWEEHGMLAYDCERDQAMAAVIHVGQGGTRIYSDPEVSDTIDWDAYKRIQDYLWSQKYRNYRFEDLQDAHEAMEEDEAVKGKLRALGYLS